MRTISKIIKRFLSNKNIKDVNKKSDKSKLLNNSTYTIKQSIGAALDALPTGKSNSKGN
ncbi:MAG: hypothetical protein R2771_13730 [Saprospiraceae bacterium]